MRAVWRSMRGSLCRGRAQWAALGVAHMGSALLNAVLVSRQE